MYVNPFWAGVATTISVELALMFVSSIIIIVKGGRKKL